MAPSDLGSAILVVGAVAAIAFGAARGRGDLRTSLPILLYIVLGAVSLVVWDGQASGVRVALGLALAILLVAHYRLRGAVADRTVDVVAVETVSEAAEVGERAYAPSIEDPFWPVGPPPIVIRGAAQGSPGGSQNRLWLAFLAVGFILMATLLFDDLNDYAGALLAWESPVVQHGLTGAMEQDIGLGRFTADRFLWDNGVLSAGDTSLYFGPPALAALRHLGTTPWSLRLASVVATLMTFWVLYYFVRRYFDATVAGVATLCFAVNTPVLFYGRYGSSIAGTLLAVVVAFFATWFFLERRRWAWLRAIPCAVALYLATLQYAPARLAVLFLLGLIPYSLVTDRRRVSWSHLVGCVLIAAACAGVWQFETSHKRQHFFVHARGEQVFSLMRNPQSISSLVGTTAKFKPGQLDDAQRIELVRMLVAKTLRELQNFVSPTRIPRSRGAVVRYDPPPMALYFAPLGILALVGLARALVGGRSWRYAATWLFALSYMVVLLFTNRVDAHRGILLVIPFAIWVGLGIREIGTVASRLGVPRVLLSGLGGALIVASLYSDVLIRYRPHAAISPAVQALAKTIAGLPGRTVYWFGRDHREVAWLQLTLLGKGERLGISAGGQMPDGMVNGLRKDKGGPKRLAVRQATQLARRNTLLLGPRSNFKDTAGLLQRNGLRVAESTAKGFPYYRIDGGSKLTGVPDEEVRPLDPIPPAPTPVPIVLSEGRRVYLSDLKATDVEFGFRPPRMDATWGGGQVRMDGNAYPKAIGTHAWTKMTFVVPRGARKFQAVVGISDEIRGCESASVEFVVKGGKGEILWSSGVVDATMSARAVEIPVLGQKKITLETTDAGDGRDCDHCNWGRAAFLLSGKKPAKRPVR